MTVQSPALTAAQEAEQKVRQSLEDKQTFLLEAGAGAGKTYSLVATLKYLIATEGRQLRRNNQRIACITYTNAATAIINGRIDSNPIVFTDTIHAFCWSLIKSFQPALRSGIAKLEAWKDRLDELEGNLGNRAVQYDLGYRRVTDDLVSLHHDDVLALTVQLLPHPKFQAILSTKYPYVLIDEYQDTSATVMDAIKAHLMGRKGGPLIGLFGDHWQRIYDNTCGRVAHDHLREIGKGANFRSCTSVVDVLNAMRPELPQAVADPEFKGSAVVYHSNSWSGTRRSGAGGGHWKGDLPAEVAHQFLEALIVRLKAEGWDFAPDKTKILMLTHNVLAAEQGYGSFTEVFKYSDDFIKKQNEYIAFFADKLEPAYDAYRRRRYGEMFEILGDAAPKLSSHGEKLAWSKAMDKLATLREEGTIGAVLDHVLTSSQLRLPDSIVRQEYEATAWNDGSGEPIPEDIERVRALRDIPYKEMIALDRFIDGFTPFATKHSVKGDEFENVLVVVGRGWNRYNFDQYLEQASTANSVPSDKWDSYERNRNLFYVSCSRSTTRLAILFTQLLSPKSTDVLKRWFGEEAVLSFQL